jgi:hypothetical protein
MPWSPKSRATYVAIDMGDREPRPDEAAIIARVFGEPDASVEEEPPTLDERIDRLVQVVRELLLALEEERREARTRETVLLDLVAAVLGPEARQVAAERLARAETP